MTDETPYTNHPGLDRGRVSGPVPVPVGGTGSEDPVMTPEEHEAIVATGMHECASDCPPMTTDRPAAEPRPTKKDYIEAAYERIQEARRIGMGETAIRVELSTMWEVAEAAQGAAPRAEGHCEHPQSEHGIFGCAMPGCPCETPHGRAAPRAEGPWEEER